MSISVLPRRGFLPSFSLGKPGQFLKRYGLLCMFMLTLSAMATAGTDTTFDGIYNVIVGWATGSLGKLLIAVGAFLVGMGIARQSVMAIVIGIGVALVMFYGPDSIAGWATGSRGKLIAVGAFLVGMGMGIFRQSVVAIVLGIGHLTDRELHGRGQPSHLAAPAALVPAHMNPAREGYPPVIACHG